MKQIYLILVVFALYSCLDGSPEFLSPMPPDSKNLNQFPKKLRGTYRVDNKESLTIDKYLITQTGIEGISFSLTNISQDTNLFLINDTLYDKSSNEKIHITITNDSVSGEYEWIDTTFIINNQNLLRRYKKTYLLNKETSDSLWRVVRLEKPEKSEISFSVISMKAEAIIVQEFTDLINPEIKNDTIVKFKLNPSQQEFIQMLNSKELFTDKETYKKNQ